MRPVSRIVLPRAEDVSTATVKLALWHLGIGSAHTHMGNTVVTRTFFATRKRVWRTEPDSWVQSSWTIALS